MPAPRFPTEKDVERGNDVHEKKLCHTQTWGTTSTDISNKRYSIQSGPINMASTDVSSIASLVDHRGSKHKGMSWWQAATVMLAETVSLGILSLPYAVSSVGLIPGTVLIIAFGFITTYTGYEVYRFKMRFPEIKSFAEAGSLIGGTAGRWLVEIMQMGMLIFIMAGHIIIFEAMAVKLSHEGICAVWWTVLALVINICCSLPRALKTNSWFSIFSCISIIAATFTALGSVVAKARETHPVFDPIVVTKEGKNTFALATAAVSNILVSYSGHIAYFNIISEMDKWSDFPRALLTTNVITTALYALAGLVIYAYSGENVASPALESAPASAGKIAYALAIPTIIVAGVIAALVACKRTYEMAWSERPHVREENSARAWVSWISIVVSLWVIAWIVGNTIPWFSSLLAIIGAAVGTWICLGFPAIFWLWSAWGEPWSGWKRRALAGVNVALLVMCFAACGLGLYGSVSAVSAETGGVRPFSCAAPKM